MLPIYVCDKLKCQILLQKSSLKIYQGCNRLGSQVSLQQCEWLKGFRMKLSSHFTLHIPVFKIKYVCLCVCSMRAVITYHHIIDRPKPQPAVLTITA